MPRRRGEGLVCQRAQGVPRLYQLHLAASRARRGLDANHLHLVCSVGRWLQRVVQYNRGFIHGQVQHTGVRHPAALVIVGSDGRHHSGRARAPGRLAFPRQRPRARGSGQMGWAGAIRAPCQRGASIAWRCVPPSPGGTLGRKRPRPASAGSGLRWIPGHGACGKRARRSKLAPTPGRIHASVTFLGGLLRQAGAVRARVLPDRSGRCCSAAAPGVAGQQCCSSWRKRRKKTLPERNTSAAVEVALRRRRLLGVAAQYGCTCTSGPNNKRGRAAATPRCC
mmetsp:Transcript_7608/g.19582  ORF Transcript_7608/g.19582 Transcript_7608/m.19582 type:complete len:280 (-) Transcript_7608:194-1033(-)